MRKAVDPVRLFAGLDAKVEAVACGVPAGLFLRRPFRVELLSVAICRPHSIAGRAYSSAKLASVSLSCFACSVR